MTSIRSTLVRSVSLAVLLVCALGFVGVFFMMRYQLFAQFDATLATQAEAIAGLIQSEDGQFEVDFPEEGLEAFRKKHHPAYYAICDATGRVIAQSEGLHVASAASTLGTHGDVTLPDGRNGRAVTIIAHGDSDDLPQQRGGQPGPFHVTVAADTGEIRSTIKRLCLVFACAFGMIAVVLLWLVPRLIRIGLAPLDTLATRAATIAPTNLHDPFPTVGVPAEIRPIVDQLNASLLRIGQAFERERQFAGNAAHELRTPLAAIRANAEVAMKWPDAQQSANSLGDILSSAIRMQSLLERLLDLARLGGHCALRREAVNLADLVQASIACNQRTLLSRKVSVNVNRDEPIVVRSDPNLLRQLIDNLVCNAAEHAPEGSLITITVSQSEAADLVIANHAPLLTPEDLERMFSPLWTKSADRSDAHSGLGLALAAEYARLLGLKILPTLGARGELRMQVHFPGATPSDELA